MNTPSVGHLAAATLAAGTPLGSALLWLGVLITLVVAAGLAILAIRRRALGGADESSPASLMEEMRRMRDDGRMTPEEFEATKRRLVARAASKLREGDWERPTRR
ncbi:MAG: hypothetical protein ACKVW3_09020 [Phycisphaerales bacterium]